MSVAPVQLDVPLLTGALSKSKLGLNPAVEAAHEESQHHGSLLNVNGFDDDCEKNYQLPQKIGFVE